MEYVQVPYILYCLHLVSVGNRGPRCQKRKYAGSLASYYSLDLKFKNLSGLRFANIRYSAIFVFDWHFYN
jgi:hypothetical protein